MDLIAVSVMRQLARNNVSMPFTDAAVEDAILDIEDRNRGTV